MKKLLIGGILAVAVLFGVLFSKDVSANKGWFDFNYEFNWCQIAMPDGSVVEGKVDKWWDYEDGDQLQVSINGVIYLTHASNMVLMCK